MFFADLLLGQNLLEPRLAENATLDAENIHRIFGHKIVWLVPTQNLVVRMHVFFFLNIIVMFISADFVKKICV